MATWKITPTWKKSVVEKQYWHKGEDTIVHDIGWRWSEFFIETETDEEPSELKEGNFDVFNCGHYLSDFSTDDGCWEETDYDINDVNAQEKVEEFLSENSIYDLEEEGWVMGDCEMWIECECEIEKVE